MIGVILSSVILILFALGVVIFIVNNKVHVSLNGSEIIKLEVFEKYKDDGVIVKRGKKEIDKDKYKVDIISTVNNTKVGNYKITYNIKYYSKSFTLVRKVKVVDSTKPELTINLEKIERDYCTKKDINTLEYTAIDNLDGDITDKVKVEEKDNKMIFEITDQNKNKTIKEIPITYTEKPDNKFYLNGDTNVSLILNQPYNDPGASYTDGCDNPIDEKISVSGIVDTSKAGEYKVSYSLANGQTLVRNVTVYEPRYAPKTIYLTFDDGPGPYTESILNTLDKYNVKATFFVTNQFPAYQAWIGEEHKRGHKVAVHTYSHSYPIVYSSLDGYVADFNQMNEIIKNYTGSYSNLFRFPGGSSNTVSYRYSPGVVSQIAAYMTSQGYVYFDWNVDSQDAEGAGSWAIYNNVVNRVENCSECVVLMHDVKAPTAEALDSLLQTLTSKGYAFATLNTSSYTAHHRIAN